MPRRALEPTEYPFFDYRRFTFSLGIVAGGMAWLSGSTAVRHDAARGMVVDGDLVAQARVIVEKMRLTLAAEGVNLGHITRLVEYVTPAALPALPQMAALRREIWGDRLPSVTTTAVKSLLRPEALIEIEAVASFDASVSPSDLLVSVAIEGNPAAGDIVGQTRDAYRRIAAQLLRAGASLDNVVKTTERITAAALAGYRQTAAVRREVFAAPYPAATGVVCERLVDRGALIAVEAVAVREGRTA